MKRVSKAWTGLCIVLLATFAQPVAAAGFTVVEASIGEMQAALREGRVTSRELVSQYLQRIATYEDRINAAISVNAGALAEADALDRERAAGRLRGPLHGIPVAVKDNPTKRRSCATCARRAPSSSPRPCSRKWPTGW